MGCHTWFYKKINPQPTWELVKENNKSRLLNEIHICQQMIDGTLEQEVIDDFPEWTKEYGEKCMIKPKKELDELLDENSKRLKFCYAYEHFKTGTGHSIFIKDKGFYVTSNFLPHDLFRIRDNLNNLFSLKETLDFMDKNKEIITTYDYTIDRLTKFWEENPDGVINFG